MSWECLPNLTVSEIFAHLKHLLATCNDQVISAALAARMAMVGNTEFTDLSRSIYGSIVDPGHMIVRQRVRDIIMAEKNEMTIAFSTAMILGLVPYDFVMRKRKNNTAEFHLGDLLRANTTKTMSDVDALTRKLTLLKAHLPSDLYTTTTNDDLACIGASLECLECLTRLKCLKCHECLESNIVQQEILERLRTKRLLDIALFKQNHPKTSFVSSDMMRIDWRMRDSPGWIVQTIRTIIKSRKQRKLKIDYTTLTYNFQRNAQHM